MHYIFPQPRRWFETRQNILRDLVQWSVDHIFFQDF